MHFLLPLQAYFLVGIHTGRFKMIKITFLIPPLKARHKMDKEINNRTCEVIKDGRYRAFLNVSFIQGCNIQIHPEATLEITRNFWKSKGDEPLPRAKASLHFLETSLSPGWSPGSCLLEVWVLSPPEFPSAWSVRLHLRSLPQRFAQNALKPFSGIPSYKWSLPSLGFQSIFLSFLLWAEFH